MSQSLVKNYIHIIYSTKNREQFLSPSIQPELFNYLGGICNNLECFPVQIGGFNDHVHILCLLSKKIALVKLIEELKSHSSKWIKTKDQLFASFYWQAGYGTFSVNPSEIEIAKKYIEMQHEHHASKSFQDEYRAFLNKYNIKFDERYIWD